MDDIIFCHYTLGGLVHYWLVDKSRSVMKEKEVLHIRPCTGHTQNKVVGNCAMSIIAVFRFVRYMDFYENVDENGKDVLMEDPD